MNVSSRSNVSIESKLRRLSIQTVLWPFLSGLLLVSCGDFQEPATSPQGTILSHPSLSQTPQQPIDENGSPPRLRHPGMPSIRRMCQRQLIGLQPNRSFLHSSLGALSCRPVGATTCLHSIRPILISLRTFMRIELTCARQEGDDVAASIALTRCRGVSHG